MGVQVRVGVRVPLPSASADLAEFATVRRFLGGCREHLRHAFDEDELHSMLEQNISLISLLSPGKFLTSGEVWAGLIVCGLFVTAAIYMRRYRDES